QQLAPQVELAQLGVAVFDFTALLLLERQAGLAGGVVEPGAHHALPAGPLAVGPVPGEDRFVAQPVKGLLVRSQRGILRAMAELHGQAVAEGQGFGGQCRTPDAQAQRESAEAATHRPTSCSRRSASRRLRAWAI